MMKKILLKSVGAILATLSLHVFAAGEVQLIKVDVYETTTRSGPHLENRATVLLSNLGTGKKVFMHTKQNGVWADLPLSFMYKAANGKEVWGIDGFPVENFVVKYQVNGKTYWDNNNNANYKVVDANIEGTRLFNTNVSAANENLFRAAGSSTVSSTVTVKNLGTNKQVNVVYTTDNWATKQTAVATFDHINSTFEFEEWNFVLNVGTTSGEVIYAVSYTVNGKTYWDNNFGLNYHSSLAFF